ncbi:hypothetical protein GCM10009557_71120 [Virgisporangium ochraceum]|uniref:Uncharacterized protein n=1 Tax=Virgisporangium ochraceum TaxID=65505 RepID=A0A8J3ZZS6_9ACTN|nr:hypothetical protein Voc01_061450 [Virgisporangium ochraceum]
MVPATAEPEPEAEIEVDGAAAAPPSLVTLHADTTTSASVAVTNPRERLIPAGLPGAWKDKTLCLKS